MKKKNQSNDDYVIVWSDDGSHLKQDTKPEVSIIGSELKLKVRLEKNSRGGKLVTVIFNFPYNPTYFKSLLKVLKARCGVGGTYKDDQLELQGDQREKIKEYLATQSVQVVFAGG